MHEEDWREVLDDADGRAIEVQKFQCPIRKLGAIEERRSESKLQHEASQFGVDGPEKIAQYEDDHPVSKADTDDIRGHQALRVHIRQRLSLLHRNLHQI